MKKCVYTCITNDYDYLRCFKNDQPKDIEFICFTDNQKLKFDDKNWNIRPIPEELKNLSKVKQQRLIKILPNRYLKDYDVSLWVDGNIQIRCNVENYIKDYPLDEITFYTRKHPTRDCIYQEAESVLKMRKDIPSIVNPQIDKYRREHFPEHYGLEETCIILRRHNAYDCQILDNMWADELIRNSHRDQLSFDYCRWKSGIRIGFLVTDRIDKDNSFRWSRHGKQ